MTSTASSSTRSAWASPSRLARPGLARSNGDETFESANEAWGRDRERVEQIRAAKWDPISYPPVDQVVAVNFPEVVKPLDVPLTDTNNPTAAIRTTVSLVSSDPPLKSIQVDCIWSYWDRGPFTNTIVTLRSPDQ